MPAGVMTSSARRGFALGISTGLVLASAFFLLQPDVQAVALQATAGPQQAGSSATMPASTTPPTDGSGSMEAVALVLRTRLAAQGGADDQWELLARSYEFLGRDADAGLARQHRTVTDDDLRDAVTASAALLPGTHRPATGDLPPAVARGSAAELIARAETQRRNRQFKEACASYAEAARTGAMSADSWADYADAQASMAGRLAGEPEKALAKALALDPRHTKALWLKASLAYEQHRYDEALATWRQLLALVPPGSSDARIVEANIVEATRLANG